MSNKIELKFLLIGDSAVGKTSLLNRYIDGKFRQSLPSTVGIDVREKTIFYRSKKKAYQIELQIWDTAGQERYRSLTRAFFRDAIGFLLVFDLTNENSFLNIRHWIDDIRSQTTDAEPITMILIGNKSDLDHQRRINKLDALELATKEGMTYLETSAFSNIHVNESIELLLDAVMLHFEGTSFSPSRYSMKINDKDEKQRKCC